jgi:hypothetical protein
MKGYKLQIDRWSFQKTLYFTMKNGKSENMKAQLACCLEVSRLASAILTDNKKHGHLEESGVRRSVQPRG